MSKRKDRTHAAQLDERIATMETRLKNLVSVIGEGHLPGNKDQALRVAALMQDVGAQLHTLASSF